MNRIFLLFLLTGVMSYAQDPQTNYPKTFYPLLDEYIKEGFERNYRAHTRILGKIEYVYFINISKNIIVDDGTRSWGSVDTFMVYTWYHVPLRDYRHIIAFNKDLYDNYYLMRRMMYQALGIIQNMKRCHNDCKHIMGAPVIDPSLVHYDAAPEQWQRELDIFYRELNKKSLK